MGAVKTFTLKRHLAKKIKQNRPLPQWFRTAAAKGETNSINCEQVKMIPTSDPKQ